MTENGADAVELFSGSHWDIVLMDVQMPTMGGMEATKLIRAHELLNHSPRTPIVALTANARLEDRQECLDAGMDDFIAKPLDQEALAHVLRKYSRAQPETASE